MKVMTLTLAAILIGGAAHAQTVAGRELEQQRRIGRGIRSGQLTPGEAGLLERKEKRLNGQIRRDRATGGGLSLAERAQINRRQNRLSDRIYTLKHNNRVF
jgi:hypothetical protein